MFLIRSIAQAMPMRREDTIAAIREMTQAASSELGFPKARILTGSVGPSDSTVIIESEYESLAQFEETLAKMNKWDGMAKFGPKMIETMVPGSHRFEIYRIQ